LPVKPEAGLIHIAFSEDEPYRSRKAKARIWQAPQAKNTRAQLRIPLLGFVDSIHAVSVPVMLTNEIACPGVHNSRIPRKKLEPMTAKD
jgi:hypothetical protein